MRNVFSIVGVVLFLSGIFIVAGEIIQEGEGRFLLIGLLVTVAGGVVFLLRPEHSGSDFPDDL